MAFGQEPLSLKVTREIEGLRVAQVCRIMTA